MSKNSQSACSQCRREAQKLYLKGQRCETPKCALSKRNYQPGAHPWTRGRPSEYRIHLREKQKTKRFYGVRDRQFKRYMTIASRATGNTGENLLTCLERRFDNAVYSLGLATSRKHARQIINHGHVTINGKKCDIASVLLREGDTIRVREKENIQKIVRDSVEQSKSKGVPSWLEQDPSQLGGKVSSLPTREHVQLEVDEQLVVEFMSR